MFHPGRTVATHFVFLGRKFDVTELNEEYFAGLDDGLLNTIRRDPGVRHVEDNADGEADVLEDQGPPEAIQHAYQAPYQPAEQYPLIGSYIIDFYPGHTVAKHFAFLGREFDLTKLDQGYFADMDDGSFNAVRRDPGVRLVMQDWSGEREQVREIYTQVVRGPQRLRAWPISHSIDTAVPLYKALVASRICCLGP